MIERCESRNFQIKQELKKHGTKTNFTHFQTKNAIYDDGGITAS